MQIIVNAISANTGGIVTYTSNLIDYMSREGLDAIVYVPPGFKHQSENTNHLVKVVPLKKRFWGPVHRFIWEQTAWRKIVRQSGAALLFSSANYGVLFPPIPQVLLVQGEIYLNPVYREKVLPKLSRRERLSAWLRRNLMLWSARCSRETIFPSEVALNAAADYDNDLHDTASVNYLGVSPRFMMDRGRRVWRADGIIRLLYVSVYYPHKDPLTLAEATRLLCERGLKTETRITMEPLDFSTWDNANEELHALQSTEYLSSLRMGRIDHSELSHALCEYDAFVFPSMAETFGFPMVEAMRAGVPLIVSDIPIHREICGEAALYFELGNPSALSRCVERLNGDQELRLQLIDFGKQRAEVFFSWGKHVAGLANTIREIIEDKRHRILINALHARTGGGVTYLRNMLPLMAQDPRLKVHVCLHEDQKKLLPTSLEGVRYHYQIYPRGFWRVLLREQLDLPRVARRLAAKAIFSPANYGPFLARNHFVMARNAVSVGFVERRPLKLAYWMLLYAATFISFARSRKVIAVSNYAKRGMERAFFGLFVDRLEIVPHGIEESYIRTTPEKKRDRFLLAVSDIYVQKNFTLLITAIAQVKRAFPDVILKIAGRPVDEDYYLKLQMLIKTYGLKNNVEFLGHVAADQLRELYVSCGLFVFPSTVETFGNPLVEAMACGAPIASSNTAAMPEVLGDAARFFDPNDVDEIVTTILSLMSCERDRIDLSRRAKNRSMVYSWEKTKEKTIQIILENS